MLKNPKGSLKKTASAVQQKASVAADAAAETAKGAKGAAGKAAKKAAVAVGEGQQRVKAAIYKPVFPEEYAAPDYDRPKMIVIEDEDERKGIDVCEGAIGWFDKAGGMEVLHLYEEAVALSGVDFHPQPVCGAVYLENKVTPGRYINLDCYFDVLEKDRLTELRRIAYELGARKCTLECREEQKSVRAAKSKLFGKTGKRKGKATARGNADVKVQETDSSKQSIVFTQTFEGAAEPKRPDLKWFKSDKEIEFLVDTRCAGDSGNTTKNYRVQLDSSSTQTMSVALAAKIDNVLGKLGYNANFSLEGEAKSEASRKLVFEVEF